MSISNSSFSKTWDGIHPLAFKIWLPDEDDPLAGPLHNLGFLNRLTTWVPAGISLMNATRVLKLSSIGFRKTYRRDKRLWTRHFTTPDGTVLSPRNVLSLIETDLNQQNPALNLRCIVRVKLSARLVRLQLIPYVLSPQGTLVPLALLRLILTPSQKLVHQDTVVKLKSDPTEYGFENGDAIPFIPSLMRNTIRLYERLGYRTIHITAGYSAGSAVWPKYAFHPRDKDMWKNLKRVISDKLAHLPRNIRVAALKRLKAINKSDETQDIYWLSDLTFKKLGVDANGVAGDYKKHKLGSILLQRLNWKGKLDLHDRRARRRLERYLEAKNCPLP